MVRRVNRRFAEDDPRRYLHVSRWRRKTKDEGPLSDAAAGGADDDFDREEVVSHSEVVSEADLNAVIEDES